MIDKKNEVLKKIEARLAEKKKESPEQSSGQPALTHRTALTNRTALTHRTALTNRT